MPEKKEGGHVAQSHTIPDITGSPLEIALDSARQAELDALNLRAELSRRQRVSGAVRPEIRKR